MTRTEEFILKNKKKLASGADFFNPDTSLLPKEKFDTADCKILLIFPSPHTVKTVSSTAAAINDYVINHCPNTFIDFAYMPEGEDIKTYDDAKVPYAIGNITHLDPSYFDIVGFSISVLSEIITAPVMIKSFSRCDRPIPLFWSDRKNLKLSECPIIYAGGITAACGEVMFGKVGDKESYIDFEYLGACEKTDVLVRRLIEAKKTGQVSRLQSDHDIPGYAHFDIEGLSDVKVETVQDYIESLFDLSMIYHPQAYEVQYNKYHRIISNKKINTKARDFVTPFYPHILANDLGIGRTIINANGDNCGVSQVQVSEGCSSAGACSFCAEGNYCGGHTEKTKEEILRESWESKKFGASYKFKPYSFNVNYITDYKGMLYEWIKIYPKVTFINMRLEELGRDTDALRMMKLVGSNRISCLDKSTLVQTKRGLIPISLVNENDEVLSLSFEETAKGGKSNPQECWNKVIAVRNQGVKPLYKILFNTGNYIIATEDHIIPTTTDCLFKTKWTDVRVDELLKSKSRRLLESSITTDSGLTEINGVTLTTEFMELAGWLMGDGYISESINRFCFGEKDSEFYLFVKNYLSKNEIHFTEDETDGEFGKTKRINVHQNNFRSLIKDLGLYGVSTEKKFPYKVFTLSTDLQCAFLKGYFSANGNVKNDSREERQNSCIRVSSISTDILRGVQLLLGKLGIQSRISKFRENSGGFENQHLIGELSIRKPSNVRRFFNMIGFSLSYKKNAVKFSEKQSNQGVRVVSVEYVYDGECWDIQVENTPYFTANNVFVHNCPIEGISPRIQNNLLNKCLSMESMNNFMEDMIHAKMTDIKVGGIFTAYEQDEDFQWICDYVRSFKEKAKEEGGNLPWRLKVTPLVHYSLTPLEYLERKSARKSFEGEHWLTDEWYEKFRENEVFFKVNGFRYSTFLEQSLVDMGRFLTPIIHKFFVENMSPIYSLRSIATDEFITYLKNVVNPFYKKSNLTDDEKLESERYMNGWFGDRHPEHYISPSHRIHIELMGSYIPRARRLVEAKQQGNVFSNEPDIRCLKTYDGAPVKCYMSCIKNNPLKIYNDVVLDEDNNLYGDYSLLNGCGRCQTAEQRKWRLTRPTPQSKNSDDIIATPRIPQVQKIRFVIYRKPEYDVLNPQNTAHTFITKFLQKSDILLKAYHSMSVHNMFWQCDPGLDYFCSGYQIVDTIWSKNVVSEVQRLITEVNESLKSVKVISAKEELRDEKIKVDDLNFFYFESEVPSAYFESALHNYDGSIRTITGMANEVTIVKDSSLFPPVFISKNGKTVGVFAIPGKYNPSNFLSSFVSVSKKTSMSQINQTTIFECLSTARETSAVCKCGKEKALISITTSKPIPLGAKCMCKALLHLKLKG